MKGSAAMGTFQDIDELVGKLAWPAVAGGALFMLRQELKNGMSDVLARLSKAKIGALDLEFEKAIGQIAGTGEPAPPPAEAAKEITAKESRAAARGHGSASVSFTVRSGLHDAEPSRFGAPNEMILWTYNTLMLAARTRMGLADSTTISLPGVAKSLDLDPSFREMAQNLQTIRNEVAHGRKEATWSSATTFASLAATFDDQVILNAYKVRRESHASP